MGSGDSLDPATKGARLCERASNLDMYRRATVAITDRRELEEQSCSCYSAVTEICAVPNGRTSRLIGEELVRLA
jgi:hypothetical protein